MTKKGNKIEDNRIQEICKDMKRIKTYQGLKKFLITELSMTQECIDERNPVVQAEMLKKVLLEGAVQYD